MRASAAFALAATAVVAQQNYTSELEMKIDPNSVPQQTRASWCQAQTNTCSLLCNNGITKNDCDVITLKYDCSCSSNSSAPGLQYYTQTMPTFICLELFGQCNRQNIGDSQAQQGCNKNIRGLCGTLNPPKGGVKDTGSSSVSNVQKAASSTAAATQQTSGASDSVTTTSSNGLAAPTMVPGGSGAAAAAAAAAIGFLAYLV